MEKAIEAAQTAITAEDDYSVLRFSHCMVPSKRPTRQLDEGWRAITTNRHQTVKFFLACWNARHEIAALAKES